MMKKFSVICASMIALMSSACANEANTASAETMQAEPEAVSVAVTTEAEVVVTTDFEAPEQAWRDLDPENTLYIDTVHGRMVIELFPEIAPIHVERIKTLARQSFYDHITFHRVIEDFMNQTGDPKGDGTGDSDLPDIQAEFNFRRSPDMGVTLFGARPKDLRNPQGGSLGVGFYRGLPVATEPSSAAIMTVDGKVQAYGLHCKGVTSMARTADPNSANSQIFLMRGMAPNLDNKYSIWGNTVWGRENLTKIAVGTVNQTPGFIPEKMDRVQVAADVPAADRVNVQVLKSDSAAFKTYLNSKKNADGTYPDICEIDVPTRLKP